MTAPVRTRSNPPASQSSTPARRKRRFSYGYLFLAPWLLGLTVFVAGPMVFSLYLSFTNFDLFNAPEWIGVDNFVNAFTADERFWNSMRVTTVYVLVSVPLKLALALAIALVLQRGIKGLKTYRAIFYLPSLLGASVAIAILWRQVFGADGLFNAGLALFGIDGPAWIAEPDYAIFTLIALAVWQFGSPMIIFLAGLQQIPGELYEAAMVDGAGRVRRFFQVTLPLLTPLVFFNLVLQMIGAFQAFTPAFIISNGTGGPSDSTLFYTLYLYEQGFTNFRMGYASALAWILFAVIAVFTAVTFVSSRYWVHYGDEGGRT